MKVLDPGPDIHWLGHDCFRIDGEQLVYTDPFKISKGPVADIILVTHDHFDHCSPEDIAKVSGPDTVIVAPAECAAKLKGHTVQTVQAGETITAKGIVIQAVPAYNVNKFRSPGVHFHPKADGKLGFIISIGGRRVYLAGDTDVIPEMSSCTCDIALLPVSGTYVMTAEEAVEAARLIKPAVAVPMHYSAIVGDDSNAQTFKRLAACPVVILSNET